MRKKKSADDEAAEYAQSVAAELDALEQKLRAGLDDPAKANDVAVYAAMLVDVLELRNILDQPELSRDERLSMIGRAFEIAWTAARRDHQMLLHFARKGIDIEVGRRSPKNRALTDLQKVDAARYFSQIRSTGVTDNNAIGQVIEKLKQQHGIDAKPDSVRRAVGLRK